MTEISKPAWVEAVDEAKSALVAASTAPSSEVDGKTRLAYAWMDIARLYKD